MNPLTTSSLSLRFAKGPAMRLIARPSVRTCPVALLLAIAPVLAQVAPTATPPEAPVTLLPESTPTTQPATTQPSTQPTTEPATQPSTQPTAATLPALEPLTRQIIPFNPSATVTFNFKDAPVDSVLDYLSQTLGFVVIKDGRIDGRITIASRQPVGADEAVDLLDSVLKPLNYTALRTGRALRIVSRDKAKKGNIPVRFGADPANIKATDELITQVIPVAGVDAVKLRQDLTALFSAEADVTANASSNTIVITDSSANIRRIVEVIAAMDRHTAATTDIKIFQLKNATASTAAKLINDVFKQDSTSQQQGQQGNQRFGPFAAMFGRGGQGPGGGPGGAAAGGSDSSSARSAKVVASADDRTNTLVVSGPTETLAVIDRVVSSLDSDPSETSTVFVYRLRNGQASHLQSVLSNLFGTSTGSTVSSTNTGTLTRSPFGSTSFGSSSSSSSGGFGSTGRTNANTNRTSNLTSGFGGFGGFGSSTSGLSTANSDLYGKVYVVADTDTNALILTSPPKYVDRVKNILTDLDRSVPQVLIKVLFAEVTHTNGSDLGFQWAYDNGSVDANGNYIGNRTAVGSDMGLSKANGGLNVAYVQGNFSAMLHALATEGKVDVLSRPYILASDNQLASILVGQQIPYVTNTRVTDTGQTINTIEYQDVGIILDVVPHINPDGKVVLDVNPQISAVVKDTTVQVTDNVNALVISKRSAQSRVAVDNGQTIVIGGLMEDKKNTIVTKVPLLGDIPLVGNLFRRSQDDKSKTELLIFLTPHVATEAAVLKGMSQDEIKGVKILPNAVTPGTFQGQLDGMTRGATTQPSEPLHAPAPTTQNNLLLP